MKIILKILAGFSFLLLTVGTTAQVSHSFGLRGGLHYSDVSVPAVQNNLNINPKGLSSYEAALFYELHLGGNFTFRPEIGYAKKGFILDEGVDFEIANFPIGIGVEALTEIHYVQIPLLAKYTFFGSDQTFRPYLMAGPSFGYGVEATMETKVKSLIDLNVNRTDIDLSNSTYERIEWAVVGGLGLEIKVGEGHHLFAEGRYIHSYTDLLNDTRIDLRLRSQGIGLSAGYKLSF